MTYTNPFADRIPALITCTVEAGTYPIGNALYPQSSPVHQVTLQRFAIGRTAVTNNLYGHFIAAGGYEQPAYWSEVGWRWQKSKKERAPAFWQDVSFNHSLQPVTGVCWYEADAFARWLAQETGLPWRLPTEIEWECAAAGHMERPWAPNPRQINSAEQGLQRPWSALGMGFVSWCGAYDMCGNIWEWTSSAWGRNWQTLEYRYPYDPNDGREDPHTSFARVMRGGSWFDPLKHAHPAYRGRYLPGSRGSNIGFRLVRNL